MKKAFPIFTLALILSGTPGFTKTINLPSTDIVDVIRNAREYLTDHHIDLTHRFLAAVEYKNIHEELEHPYWLLTWALAAGTSDGPLYVRVFNNGEIDMACAGRGVCPPGVNETFTKPVTRY